MNSIQRAAFAHLTDGSGSGQRSQALHILTRDDFFTEATEDQSRDAVHAFIEQYGPRGENQFCDEGIGRFLEAIGLETPSSTGPQDDQLVVTVVLRLHRDDGLALNDDDSGYDEVQQIVSGKLVPVLSLAQGDDWRVSDVVLDQWDVN